MSEGLDRGARLARAAAKCIGVKFRLHGRDPLIGLDCVGLVYISLKATGASPIAPAGYRLRNVSPSRWLEFAARSGLRPAIGSVATGDVIMVSPGPCQQHLIIAESDESGIHAHAGLGCVVRQPIQRTWSMLAHWRLK